MWTKALQRLWSDSVDLWSLSSYPWRRECLCVFLTGTFPSVIRFPFFLSLICFTEESEWAPLPPQAFSSSLSVHVVHNKLESSESFHKIRSFQADDQYKIMDGDWNRSSFSFLWILMILTTHLLPSNTDQSPVLTIKHRQLLVVTRDPWTRHHLSKKWAELVEMTLFFFLLILIQDSFVSPD